MIPPSIVRPRALLFDWDNTLVDGWGVICEAMNAALAAMGQPPWSVADTRARVRASLRDSFPRMFGARWEEAMRVFYDRFEASHLERLSPMDGAGELLEGLARRGFYLGVVSNKTGRYLRREAEHLGWSGHFARLVGAGDALRDKPAWEPVELALAGAGIARGPDVWLVGDADIDMACAVNAGCLPVLLRAAPPEPGEFPGPGPACHRRNCRQLLRLIEHL